MLLDDGLHFLGQGVPVFRIGQEPETIPHVIGHREIFLHFVQFAGLDNRQRIFLPFNHFGLQGRIDFREVDAGGC